MRREFKDMYAEFGPLLAFDASTQARWATQTFDSFIMNDGHVAEAEAGWCTWLDTTGIRQFQGTVELLVDEPAPEHTQYAVQHAAKLWLRVPSGKLVLSARGAVLPDAKEHGDAFRHELDVPPGDYEVEAWGYVEHELRLENQQTPLPGEPPRSRWWTVVTVLQIGMALLSLCAVFFAVAAFKTATWDWLVIDVLAVASGWSVLEVFRRVSGVAANSRARDEAFNRVLAALPPVPDFTLSLKKVELAPQRGGGVTNDLPPLV